PTCLSVPPSPDPRDLPAFPTRRSSDLVNGSMTILLPGITDPGRKPFPDVMRGEETQIVGVGLHCDATLVLPGTHSKWARVEGGRSEEHTSELQSREKLVCRLLLEKKNA